MVESSTFKSRLSLTNPGAWLRYSNLKLEAAVFMLIALTFAAVLGQEAITSKSTDITTRIGQYYSFAYGDYNEGGKSSVESKSSEPLKWSCTLRPGTPYAYCGYGYFLDVNSTGAGFDFSQYQTIKVRLKYSGAGDRVRMLLQTKVPESLQHKAKMDETVPLVAEFSVVQGENELTLNRDQFLVEQWWLNNHNITPDEADIPIDRLMSVALGSGSEAPHGRFDVQLHALEFKGTSLSTAQWYLLILGAWLVLTGGFLVYRFLGMNRAFEIRQARQAEESRILAQAREAAEAASAAKSQFLANMSHELRTPLNAVLGYAQLLSSTELTATQSTAVRTIYHSGEHLLTMITDILDIAKVEAGMLELIQEACEVRACVTTVGQMVRLRAEEKGLTFGVRVDDGVPSKVLTDQKRLRQVLINLLTNAVKFTSAGEVRLEVTSDHTENGQFLRFDIIDTGIGIPQDQIVRIFKPFEQVGNAIDRSSGTGLGLSITHQIVGMMGGHIKVESQPGQGSRFIVFLPVSVTADESALARPIIADAGQYTILLVDNNTDVRQLLRKALEVHGLNILEAGDGAEALAIVATRRPSLVLMDVKMPVLNGLEATRKIRVGADASDIPIIILTAHPSDQVTHSAREAGATHVMSKPVDLVALAKMLAELLPTVAQVTTDSPVEASCLIAPPHDTLDHLLDLARAGNLRGIRKAVPDILAMGTAYHAFANRLDALAATYQSPAVLRLIEQYAQERTVA